MTDTNARDNRSAAAAAWNTAQQALARNDIATAIAALEQAALCAPDVVDVHLQLAHLHHHRADLAGAERSLRDALSCDPGNTTARLGLANVLSDAERHRDVLALIATFPASLVQLPLSRRLCALALWRTGRSEEALAELQAVLAQDPRDADALQLRGLIHQHAHRPWDAATDFTVAAQLRHAPGTASSARERTYWSRAKLRHDAEQFAHLAQQDARFERLSRLHAEAMAQVPADIPDDAIVAIPGDWLRAHGRDYNRLQHLAVAERLADGALNPAVDWAAVQASYLQRQPGIAHVDAMLRPEALRLLRDYCMASTLWFDFQHPNGYLGASFQNGFCAPLLLQIADELRMHLPAILGDHPLTQLWAFKYDATLDGIDRHADLAAVNLNFWITPDEANLDPEGGGLLLWDKRAPKDWGFEAYNSASAEGQARIARFLEESGARMVRVAHRQNRAVLFDSDLFHRTDAIRFRTGYEHRRINITMLFGYRDGA